MLTLFVCVGAVAGLRCAAEGTGQSFRTREPGESAVVLPGLQELVSFSAFMGGVGIPGIVLLGLGLIPYLDREPKARANGSAVPAAGRWCSARIVVGLCAAIVLEGSSSASAGYASGGPHVPQLVVTALNPGTILTLIYALYSVYLSAATNPRAPARLACSPVSCAGSSCSRSSAPISVGRTGPSTGHPRSGRNIDAMKNKYLLLISSLGVLLLLVAAAWQENFLREWRRVQSAGRSDSGAIPVQLRQIVNPALRSSDRCVSCHVTMGPGEQSVSGIEAPCAPQAGGP